MPLYIRATLKRTFIARPVNIPSSESVATSIAIYEKALAEYHQQ